MADILRPWWQLNGFTRVRGTDRFWARVQKTRDPAACWPWLNGRNGAGYGVMRWYQHCHYAHRLAYELYHGYPVPHHLVVRHLCGNQLCCRPSHLAVGTPQDNSDDMVAQGHHRNHALSHNQVRDIRHLAEHKARLVDISLHYGVTQHTIWQIVTRRTYRHVEAA
jgi:hypothetical protein